MVFTKKLYSGYINIRKLKITIENRKIQPILEEEKSPEWFLQKEQKRTRDKKARDKKGQEEEEKKKKKKKKKKILYYILYILLYLF